MLSWVVVVLLCLSQKTNGDCGLEFLDLVAAITDQYRTVSEGVLAKYNGWEATPSFTSIVNNDLKHDICELTNYATETYAQCATCPDCGIGDLRCSFRKGDVGFIFDESNSINAADFIIAREFLADLICKLHVAERPDTIRVALVSFGQKRKLRFKFIDHINNTKPGAAFFVEQMTRMTDISQTNLFKPLNVYNNTYLLESNGNRPNVSDTLIIITDGESTNRQQTEDAYNNLTSHYPELEVVTVGIGNQIDLEELNFLATDPSNVFFVDDFDALDNILNQVLQFVCEPCDVCENGGTCDDITNTCTCPDGFIGSMCQTKSLCPTW